jgi:hypothetical protein
MLFHCVRFHCMFDGEVCIPIKRTARQMTIHSFNHSLHFIVLGGHTCHKNVHYGDTGHGETVKYGYLFV